MDPSRGRVALLLTLAALGAGAVLGCADEDLDVASAPGMTVTGVGASASKSTVVVAGEGPSIVVRAAPAPSGAGTRAQVPIFYRYEVKEGDTVASLVERFGVGRNSIVWNNEGALRGGDVVPGTLLDIPSADGILHPIRLGETLTEIAARYGVEAQAIIDFPANNVSNPSAAPGSILLVPGGRKP
jgi:LysM repeat protein